MEAKKKNMVILKNLPSNLIEEAIVILKENNKIKKYQYAKENKEEEKKKKTKEDNSINRKYEENCVQSVNKRDKKTDKTANLSTENEYIIKEAEMIISNYISELETKSTKWKNNIKKLENKYKTSLKLNFLLAFTTIISFAISII